MGEICSVLLQPVTPKLNGCFGHFSCQYLFPASVFGVSVPVIMEAALGFLLWRWNNFVYY